MILFPHLARTALALTLGCLVTAAQAAPDAKLKAAA